MSGSVRCRDHSPRSVCSAEWIRQQVTPLKAHYMRICDAQFRGRCNRQRCRRGHFLCLCQEFVRRRTLSVILTADVMRRITIRRQSRRRAETSRNTEGQHVIAKLRLNLKQLSGQSHRQRVDFSPDLTNTPGPNTKYLHILWENALSDVFQDPRWHPL